MFHLAVGFVLVLATFTGSVKSACSSGCTSCSGSTCMSCGSSYFLTSGNCISCPENCSTCDRYEKCTSCKSNKWSLLNQCTLNCVTDCLNTECHDDNGFCLSCKPGTYGLRCRYDCSHCKDSRCELRMCTLGCKSGFYNYSSGTDSNTFCQRCPSHCKSCKDAKLCNVCNDGFFLRYAISNENVMSVCIQCPIYCKTCVNLNSSTVCTGCFEGYMLDSDKCVLNENNCSNGCSSGCSENGICLGSCYAGWTGERCLHLCASQCLKCLKNNASICEVCKHDFYTVTCDVGCNQSCLKAEGKQTCRQNDGYCLNGCEKTFWGQNCNQLCSDGCVDDGISRVCDSGNGMCTNGCVVGYTGDTCESTVSKTSTMVSAALTTPNISTVGKIDGSVLEDDTNVIIIGAGAGGGVLLVLIIIVIIFCLVKRRRKSNKSRGNDEAVQNVVSQSENDVAIPDAHLYAQPMKPKKEGKTEEKQDYIYAQPNKPKTAKKPSKKEISEPYKLYDNVAVDLKDEKATPKENNVDILQLENLDEGSISFIETEVNIPTADTYYNTASLIRSRIQVPNLNEYIKMKTDYEKEFEKLPKGLTRTCNEALKPRNLAKNRYNGIYAYDATRVVLQSKSYINANYIDGNKTSPEYIASLGPTRAAMNKFEAFWETIWQERTDKIVMLTNLEESGKMKCEQYWPRQGASEKYGDYKVANTAEKVFSEFVVREFNIKRVSETRKVIQYHYTAWPDKTVPDTVDSLVEFRDKVEQAQTTSPGPMMVHCSAGIGRTGTYIALDMLIKKGKEEDSIDIFGCVAALRGQRAHMVQNLEQYSYLHHCVLYALTCDPQPFPVTTIQVMTDDKISLQYQAFMELLMPPSKDRRSVAINKSRKENRKGADIPGDAHRVRLTLTKYDYINAVYLNGYLKDDKFIIAQTPLPSTVEDFVSMLYQEKCPCVVCLDKEHTNDNTVGQYLPLANKVVTFGRFQVAYKSSNSTEDFVIRNLKITKTGSPSNQDVTVRHYQFRGWSSSTSVPKSVQSFLNLVVDIEKARKSCNSDQPIAIHCLHGSERSSVFCVVSILLEKFAVEGEVSMLNAVCHVRSRRQSAFQDIEHFRFCYACVKEMIKISDMTDYYNFLNG